MSRVCANYFSCYTFYMIMWHKRLIIFLLKVFGVILLIIAVALFFYYQYFFKKDNLIKYVPQNAVFYSTFRLNNEVKENQFVRNFIMQTDPGLTDINLNNLNYMVAYNAALALIPKENDNFNFDYLLIFNLNNKPINIEQEFNFISKYQLKYFLQTNQALEKNILIISNSDMILNKVRNITAYREESLAKNANILLGLNKITVDHNARIYFDFSNLPNSLNKINDLPLKLAMFSLTSDNKRQLFLGAKFINDQIIISSPDSVDEGEANSENYITQVPKDTIFSLTFKQGDNSWFNVSEKIKEFDLQTYLTLEKNLAYWQNIYKFNLRSDIFLFLTNQSQLIITKDHKYILILETPIKDVTKLEESIKLFLATNNPQEEDKSLPDYSTITKIVRKPENYNFAIRKINDIDLHYLVDTAEFGYYFQDNKLVLANSITKLEDLLNKTNLLNINELSNCAMNFDKNSDNIYINNEFITNLSPEIANLRKLFKNIEFTGNFKENGKFWLCLE